MTERSVELEIAKKWIKNLKGDVIEIGAVTPYYFGNAIKDIEDPTDGNKRVKYHKSIFDVDLKGKNVLSISTVEHISLNEYGLSEKRNSVEAIKYILDNCKSCLITYPIGYNPLLDKWTVEHEGGVTVLKRGYLNNKWIEIKNKKNMRISYGPLWANAVGIIKK